MRKVEEQDELKQNSIQCPTFGPWAGPSRPPTSPTPTPTCPTGSAGDFRGGLGLHHK